MSNEQTSKYWPVKSPTIRGKNYGRVIKEAMVIFHSIERSSKRRAYIRSSFFLKEKIFLNLFWEHLKQKNPKDRRRRLRYYGTAIELLQKTKFSPLILKLASRPNEILYKFFGITNENEIFVAQIKEISNGEKHLISIFPYENLEK